MGGCPRRFSGAIAIRAPESRRVRGPRTPYPPRATKSRPGGRAGWAGDPRLEGGPGSLEERPSVKRQAPAPSPALKAAATIFCAGDSGPRRTHVHWKGATRSFAPPPSLHGCPPPPRGYFRSKTRRHSYFFGSPGARDSSLETPDVGGCAVVTTQLLSQSQGVRRCDALLVQEEQQSCPPRRSLGRI